MYSALERWGVTVSYTHLTPFRKEEIKGLVESLSSAGVRNIELLEITYEDNLKCFALNERCTQVDGLSLIHI